MKNELTTTPVTPSEGAADPRAVLIPATATSVTVTQVKKLSDLSSVELDAYIKDRARRCERHVAGFTRRVSELYLALLEMEGRFNKQQGARTDLKELHAQTWTEYVEASGANPDAYRKWKSRMNAATKQLDTVVTADGSARQRSDSSSAAQAAQKALADAKAQLGASAEAGNEQAKAIIAGYEKAVNDAAVVKPEQTKSSPEMRVNKRLAAIVEVAERYIRVMERVVKDTTPTERQKKDIEKASEAWHKVLQDARQLSWAIKIIERQEEEEEAA